MKGEFRSTAFCNVGGEPLPASEITLTDLPSPGLGDESVGWSCGARRWVFMVVAYAWRVDNVVQILIGPETTVPMLELAEKVEARKEDAPG